VAEDPVVGHEVGAVGEPQGVGGPAHLVLKGLRSEDGPEVVGLEGLGVQPAPPAEVGKAREAGPEEDVVPLEEGGVLGGEVEGKPRLLPGEADADGGLPLELEGLVKLRQGEDGGEDLLASKSSVG